MASDDYDRDNTPEFQLRFNIMEACVIVFLVSGVCALITLVW